MESLVYLDIQNFCMVWLSVVQTQDNTGSLGPFDIQFEFEYAGKKVDLEILFGFFSSFIFLLWGKKRMYKLMC